MQNEDGDTVELYFPRKCTSHFLLLLIADSDYFCHRPFDHSYDHASVQINIGRVDRHGRYTGEVDTFALCGFIRLVGQADAALYRFYKDGKKNERK